MNPGFEEIFARLRKVLEPYAARLKVTADAPDYYCLEVVYSPKFKKAFPVAGVKIGKGYESYHYMPVYMLPKLPMSAKLRARMQGKSCFNFKALDETLFKELEAVTAEGFAICRKAGFASE